MGLSCIVKNGVMIIEWTTSDDKMDECQVNGSMYTVKMDNCCHLTSQMEQNINLKVILGPDHFLLRAL